MRGHRAEALGFARGRHGRGAGRAEAAIEAFTSARMTRGPALREIGAATLGAGCIRGGGPALEKPSSGSTRRGQGGGPRQALEACDAGITAPAAAAGLSRALLVPIPPPGAGRPTGKTLERVEVAGAISLHDLATASVARSRYGAARPGARTQSGGGSAESDGFGSLLLASVGTLPRQGLLGDAAGATDRQTFRLNADGHPQAPRPLSPRLRRLPCRAWASSPAADNATRHRTKSVSWCRPTSRRAARSSPAHQLGRVLGRDGRGAARGRRAAGPRR
jgi:hypothetical protein